MYKIFIDTNVFLDFYRIHTKDNIVEIINEIVRYKRYFISTEQTFDEFLRNRSKMISEFIDILKGKRVSSFQNNFIAVLDGYEEYADCVKRTNVAIDKMIVKCEKMITDYLEDPIYNIFRNICDKNSIYVRTDAIIDKAFRRKLIGNPPTSSKNTCGDEVIWETLLENCFDDLIIVSRDKTFKENYMFLKNEYQKLKQKDFVLLETITDAIRFNGEVPSRALEDIEGDLIVEDEITKYGVLQDNSNWVNIIYYSLVRLGGEADLKDIYRTVFEVVSSKYPEKMRNKEMEATIRGILQRYSADSKHYNKQVDLFTMIGRGRWAIKS